MTAITSGTHEWIAGGAISVEEAKELVKAPSGKIRLVIEEK